MSKYTIGELYLGKACPEFGCGDFTKPARAKAPAQVLPRVVAGSGSKGKTPKKKAPAKSIKEYKKTPKAPHVRCYINHPPLPLGGALSVYGGSCSAPVSKSHDVYIGFDASMIKTSRRFPWVEGNEVPLSITDMQAPPNHNEFKSLVIWTAEQIIAGKSVHAGCIGGHGRTGTFFAALVKHMMGVDDAITYVRKNYCKKAVESSAQIEYLHTQWGVTRVAAAKKVNHIASGGSSFSYGGSGAHGKKSYSPVTTSSRRVWG